MSNFLWPRLSTKGVFLIHRKRQRSGLPSDMDDGQSGLSLLLYGISVKRRYRLRISFIYLDIQGNEEDRPVA